MPIEQLPKERENINTVGTFRRTRRFIDDEVLIGILPLSSLAALPEPLQCRIMHVSEKDFIPDRGSKSKTVSQKPVDGLLVVRQFDGKKPGMVLSHPGIKGEGNELIIPKNQFGQLPGAFGLYIWALPQDIDKSTMDVLKRKRGK